MDTLRFSGVTFCHSYYDRAWGELYEKPTPDTVKARITFHYKDTYPFFVDEGDEIRLTAECANGKWMRDIKGKVIRITHQMRVGATYEVLLYRKSASTGNA